MQDGGTARRVGMVLIEVAGGALMGALLAVGGSWVGRAIGMGSADGWGDLVGSILGAIAGYVAGVPLGVIGSARLMRRQGSRWQAFAGSLLGGVGALLLAEPLRLNREAAVLMAAFGIIVLVGAIVGYHSSRRINRERSDDKAGSKSEQ